jgi:hypothetical protein
MQPCRTDATMLPRCNHAPSGPRAHPTGGAPRPRRGRTRKPCGQRLLGLRPIGVRVCDWAVPIPRQHPAPPTQRPPPGFHTGRWLRRPASGSRSVVVTTGHRQASRRAIADVSKEAPTTLLNVAVAGRCVFRLSVPRRDFRRRANAAPIGRRTASVAMRPHRSNILRFPRSPLVRRGVQLAHRGAWRRSPVPQWIRLAVTTCPR